MRIHAFEWRRTACRFVLCGWISCTDVMSALPVRIEEDADEVLFPRPLLESDTGMPMVMVHRLHQDFALRGFWAPYKHVNTPHGRTEIWIFEIPMLTLFPSNFIFIVLFQARTPLASHVNFRCIHVYFHLKMVVRPKHVEDNLNKIVNKYWNRVALDGSPRTWYFKVV
jgi:hypothetical protein